VYCARISNYQPLPDGNKRTGYDVMLEFVERNGRRWKHGLGGLAETASMIERVSGKEPAITEEEFVAWVARRIA
jgi:prophage maintenance system killer protein